MRVRLGQVFDLLAMAEAAERPVYFLAREAAAEVEDLV